jgi:hypothetical protein
MHITSGDMMRRLALLCVLFALFVFGCSSQKTASDEAPVAQTTGAAPALPMAVPEGTFALARMDMQQVRGAYDHVDSLIRLGMQNAPASRQERVPKIDDPVKVALTALMSLERGPGRVMADPTNVPDDYMAGLADDGTVFAAFSTAGNERLLRAMENDVPANGTMTVPRGYFVRLYLPASDSDALESWLEEACGGRGLECGPSPSIESRERGVVFDLRVGYDSGFFEHFEIDPEIEAPEVDENFFASRTASMDSFMRTECALGLYLRSEQLAAVGAVQGMREAFEALAHASPENRQQLFYRGMALAGGVFDMLSPESREVVDSALLIRATYEVGVVVDSVRGFTELGSKVSEAGAADVSAGSVGDDAMLQLEVAYNIAEARAEAVTPSWMQMGSRRDAYDVARGLRNAGIWGYGLAAHNYPAGFGRGVTNLAVAEGDEEAVIANQTEYLRAVRMSLDAKPGADNPVGIEPRGALVAVFDRRADIERWVRDAQQELSSAPFPISIEVVDLDETKEVRVIVGDDASVGEAAPVAEMLRATLDLLALRSLTEEVRPGVGDVDEMSAVAAPVLSELARVEIRSRRHAFGSHMRMTIGKADAPELAFADGLKPAPQPSATPACLQEVRRASSKANRALQKAAPDERARLMVRISEELEQLGSDCTDHADDIAWMRARWLEQAGTYFANALQLERAAQTFESGCSLGDERSCELAERARNPDIGATLATVPGPVRTWVGQQSGLPVLTRNYVDRWEFQSPFGVSYDARESLEGVDWTDERQRRKVIRMLSGYSRTGFPLLVDRAADARVVGWVAAQAGEEQNRGVRRYRRSTNHELGLLVPVQVDGRPGVGRLALHGPGGENRPHLRLEVGADGIDVAVVNSSGSKKVDPIGDCAPDGPTVCATGDLASIGDRLAKLEGQKQRALVDTYVDQLRIADAIDQIDGLEIDPKPEHVTIAVEEGVPFQAIAELAQQLESLGLTGGEDLVVRLDPGSNGESIQ